METPPKDRIILYEANLLLTLDPSHLFLIVSELRFEYVYKVGSSRLKATMPSREPSFRAKSKVSKKTIAFAIPT